MTEGLRPEDYLLKHDRALYGYNGESGLIGRVEKLEEMSRAIMRLLVGIGTGVGIAIILGLLALLKIP